DVAGRENDLAGRDHDVAGPHYCMQRKEGLPADGMMAARSPTGTSAHPAGSSASTLQQTQLYAALVDKSRVRSIIAIKHEAHVTPILIRNFLFIFMHFLDVQASSAYRDRF